MIDAWLVIYLVLFGIAGAGCFVLAARRPRLQPVLVCISRGRAEYDLLQAHPALDWRCFVLYFLRRLLDPPDTTGSAPINLWIEVGGRDLRILPVDGVTPRILALPCALGRVGPFSGGDT